MYSQLPLILLSVIGRITTDVLKEEQKSGLAQGDRITGKVELLEVELSAVDCTQSPS